MPKRNQQTGKIELSRREFGIGAVVTLAGATTLGKLLLGSPSSSPNQARQQLWHDLSATATAGVGQEVVGDAAEHFSPELIARVRQAVGMVRVRFSKPDGNFDFQSGTAWLLTPPRSAENQAAFDDGSVYLAMSAHVFTKYGKYPPNMVSQVTFGRPHVDSDFTNVPGASVGAFMPTTYVYRDWSNDYCIARLIPSPDAPLDNLRGQGLTINTDHNVQSGEQLLVAGFSDEFTMMQTNPLAHVPLNASTATVTDLEAGTFYANCLTDSGASGSPFVTASGEVVAILTGGDEDAENRTFATDLRRIAPLLAEASRNTK